MSRAEPRLGTDIESQELEKPSDPTGRASQNGRGNAADDQPVSKRQSTKQKQRSVGAHPLWEPGLVDRFRAYLVSPWFQSSVQLALSERPAPSTRGSYPKPTVLITTDAVSQGFAPGSQVALSHSHLVSHALACKAYLRLVTPPLLPARDAAVC